MLEVGRAQRTIFVARYLRSRDLQREIIEGLHVVEAFNGANSVIYYGKGGEIASNRHDEQELTVLCLPLMLQDVLAEDARAELLTPEDRRGLTPLFWQHVLPHGEVKLDMTTRLTIRTAGPRTGERSVPRNRIPHRAGVEAQCLAAGRAGRRRRIAVGPAERCGRIATQP